MVGHELTNNDIKQGQETNQIRKHEVGTHDTHDRGPFIGFMSGERGGYSMVSIPSSSCYVVNGL